MDHYKHATAAADILRNAGNASSEGMIHALLYIGQQVERLADETAQRVKDEREWNDSDLAARAKGPFG